MRVFYEVGIEEDLTGQLYCCQKAYEKEEIAKKKFRAVSTISNQLQKLFSAFGVKNGRQLCGIYYDRLKELGVSFDYEPVMRSVIACFLLGVFSLSFYHEHDDMRRTRRTARTEQVYKIRGRRLET